MTRGIFFDAIDGSIIDGIHRANALAQLGIATIDAYVGDIENVDPDWIRDDDPNEDDDESADRLP